MGAGDDGVGVVFIALMRTEGELSLCGWSATGPLLAAGAGGLYFFRLDRGGRRP
ncbi:hypothetical protein ACGFNV_04955 [Streptomyces sp. NPDC048751]|uniref:hypothetical protein n=1 Tax=Streptomyces sp. NPDC048751 TaxID=3365591 RepID=UPI003711CC9C